MAQTSIVILIAEQKNNMRLRRKELRDTTNPFEIPEERFIEMYRLPTSLALNLIEELQQVRTGREISASIPFHLEVLSTLNFYASGSYQRRIGMDHLTCMSQSKVSRIINNVSMLISMNLANKYIRFPYTSEDFNTKRNRFLEQNNFPGIVGLIDCTHIALCGLPTNKEHSYVNRKGFHSINVQLVCDADRRFLNVNARYAGSNHDSHIYRNSAVCGVLQRAYEERGEQQWLLGDSGYPLQPWLLTPFANPRTQSQRIFNNHHTKIRSLIERCIGILKIRFRCLLGERKLRYSHFKCGHIIHSCVTLHNYLLQNGYDVERDIEFQPNISHTSNRVRSGPYLTQAQRIRNDVANNLI